MLDPCLCFSKQTTDHFTATAIHSTLSDKQVSNPLWSRYCAFPRVGSQALWNLWDVTKTNVRNFTELNLSGQWNSSVGRGTCRQARQPEFISRIPQDSISEPTSESCPLTFICALWHACARTHTHTHIYTHIHKHIHTHTLDKHTHTCTYTRTYTQICTHISHTNTLTHPPTHGESLNGSTHISKAWR